MAPAPALLSGPRLLVARELGRALVDAALLPLRAFDAWAESDALRAEVAAALVQRAGVVEAAPPERTSERPLAIFVSCAEASGELHAVNLVRALQARLAAAGAPPARFRGLGGSALAAAGVELLADPVSRATMGLGGALRGLGFYLGLLRDAARTFRDERPDVLVCVDSPALHVPLGRIARRSGVPVVHFVAPQYWGWAPWRVDGYRGAVDRTLTILPFEPAWFAGRGVATVHVGHPLLDELADVDAPRADDGGAGDDGAPVLAVLGGSRDGVLARNLPWMLDVAAEVARRRPELRLVLPHAAFSVSGTVLLDLLHQRLPAVVVYRLSRRAEVWAYRNFLNCPWFASPNLLAGRAVYPEFCFAGDGPRRAAADALEAALFDRGERARQRAGLEDAAHALGPPGACRRAAAQVLALASRTLVRPGG